MTRFGTFPILDWNLDGEETSSMENLREAIWQLPLMGSVTNLAGGMEIIIHQVFGSPGDKSVLLLLLENA